MLPFERELSGGLRDFGEMLFSPFWTIPLNPPSRRGKRIPNPFRGGRNII